MLGYENEYIIAQTKAPVASMLIDSNITNYVSWLVIHLFDWYLKVTKVDLCVTLDPTMKYTLLSSDQSWWPYGTSTSGWSLRDLWPQLHSGKEFSWSNFVATEYFRHIDLWLNLADTCLTFNPAMYFALVRSSFD